MANDKLVLTFGFVVAGLELPDEKEKPLVAAGVEVPAAGCCEAVDRPKVGAAVVVVMVVEPRDGKPEVMPPVPVLAGELKEKVGLMIEPA